MQHMNETLSIEYAMARRQFPGESAEEIAERMTAQLTPELQLALAEDALLWHQEPASRRDLALLSVLNFVLAIEADPQDQR